MPGTFTILHALLSSYPALPAGMSLARQRRAALTPPPPSRGVMAVEVVLGLSVVYGCSFSLLCGGLVFIRILFWGNRVPLAPPGIAVGLVLLAASLMIVIGGVYRTIRAEQTRQIWPLLLLLPYERSHIILHTVARAYKPVVPLLSLAIVALAARQLTGFHVGPLLGFYALLVLEGLQLLALGVAVGIALAAPRYRKLGGFGPLLAGGGLVLLRGAGGWGAARLAGLSGQDVLTALLVGPLSGAALPITAPARTVLVAAYLLLLEAAVRRTFDWGVAHAGEE